MNQHRTNPTPIEPARAGVPSGRLRARYLRMILFFAGVVLSVLWWDILLRRIGLRWLARRTAERRYRRAAHRFRLLATRMGGVWIKVGQFLSARLDILPESVTSELAGLQDEVQAESFHVMRTTIEDAFDLPLEARYQQFDPQPLASASLGQVHRARLPQGDSVVVKVQRPGIRDLIRVDLEALETVVGWIKRYPPINRRADLDALLEEFSHTLWQEVDYLAEAQNAHRFGAMFAADPQVRIPAVYDEFTTDEVLTLEDVYFIKITEYEAIEAAGVDLAEVAKRLFDTYLRQIFLEGFFHADPHPGNLFVEPLEQGEWRLVFVDFGMVGRVTAEVKQGLRDLAIAIGTRDIDRLMQAYQRIGLFLPGADLKRIREAEAAMFDRLWGKSMRELVQTHPQEMRQFAREFRDVLYAMPFQIPSDLLYLGRCVAILSGMCTGLHPDFNLFAGLRPFAESLLTEEGGVNFDEIVNIFVTQIQALIRMPSRVDQILGRIERGELEVIARPSTRLEQQIQALTKTLDRLVWAILFAVWLLAGSIFYISGERLLGTIGFGMAIFFLIVMILR